MNVKYDFSSEVVIVTGGASGIGAGFVEAYARAGGTAVALDVNEDGLRQLRETEVGPGKIMTMYCNVSDSNQVNEVVSRVISDTGRVDGLVMSAAIQPRTEVADMPDAEWAKVLAVNLNGALYCSRAVVPTMKQQRNGSIVTFASGLASQGWASASAYASTKAALITFAKSLARELLPYGVRVNSLAPGVTDSPLFTGPNTPEEQDFFRRRGGSVGTVEDVVKLLFFLVSDASSSLTGSLVNRELIFPQSQERC